MQTVYTDESVIRNQGGPDARYLNSVLPCVAMIDHVSVHVKDFGRSLAFYKAALAPIGYAVMMEYPGGAGMGKDGKPDLWLSSTDDAITPSHVAFVGDRSQVDAFHKAALGAGGKDNGSPGLRPQYHPSYYAAFVLDPDGNNIEVVSHQ